MSFAAGEFFSVSLVCYATQPCSVLYICTVHPEATAGLSGAQGNNNSHGESLTITHDKLDNAVQEK